VLLDHWSVAAALTRGEVVEQFGFYPLEVAECGVQDQEMVKLCQHATVTTTTTVIIIAINVIIVVVIINFMYLLI